MKLWIYDYSTTDALVTENIDARLDRFVEAGVTDVIVAAWYWGGATWQTHSEELARYAAEARARSLRVHAYWTVGLRRFGDDAYTWPGASEKFYAIHDAEFQRWWLGLVDEFLHWGASHYFDGISLDYLRTGGAPSDYSVYGPLFKDQTNHHMETAYRLTFLGAYQSDLEFVRRRMQELYGIDIRETLPEYSVASMQEAIERFTMWMREPCETLARGVRELFSKEISNYGANWRHSHDQGRDLNLLNEKRYTDTALTIVENVSERDLLRARCGFASPQHGKPLLQPEISRTVPVMRLYDNPQDQNPKPDDDVVAQLATLRRVFGGDVCLYPYSNREHVFLSSELAAQIAQNATTVPTGTQ